MSPASAQPFVSCIMPTRNRRQFVAHALDYFFRQDYAARELIVIDDGTEPVDDLMPSDSRIRYVRLPTPTSLGEKRNQACELARGAFIAHWDDDDWQAPHRLRHQLQLLERHGAELCGIFRRLVYAPGREQAWVLTNRQERRHLPSFGSLCYSREFWQQNPFDSREDIADLAFVEAAAPRRIAFMPDASLQVSIFHTRNARMKEPGGPLWQAYPVERIRSVLGTDVTFYHRFSAGRGMRELNLPSASDLPTSARIFGAFTVARMTDLSLPEFQAFAGGESQSPQLWWAQAFAYSQAQLSSTQSVLSCSLEDAGFQARLLQQYPMVVSRTCNPLADGALVLPHMLPDESFDRVLCINMLEHLSPDQREQLMASLVRKLKPGGLFVVTSLTSPDRPVADDQGTPSLVSGETTASELKSAGSSPDGAEQLSAAITPAELRALCHQHGLFARTVAEDGPRNDDPDLLKEESGPPELLVGAALYKRPRLALPSRSVVLALLTWNKRGVSLDSVMAYLREARMLRRLGVRPFICVCDNGSTDGTPEALRGIEPMIDVPHRFIFNGENRGNCVARNQIIDYLLETGADYLLFMDGDIEVVPCSSFAMLRYLEDSGHRVGCIGADSGNQTPRRHLASPYLFSVHGCHIDTDNHVAWTQYGMFRREVFEAGVRFDESGPFAGPGWGFEDNDLAFQMDQAGFLLQRFFGMTYLHRDLRSSVRIMKERGIDATEICERRRLHVIDKWRDVTSILEGPLRTIQAMRFHEL